MAAHSYNIAWTDALTVTSDRWQKTRTRLRVRILKAGSSDRSVSHEHSAASGGPGRQLCGQAASQAPPPLSAGAYAGAAVPLQPGLRRLRQDRLSRSDPEPAALGG